jgi:hypothetical protein
MIQQDWFATVLISGFTPWSSWSRWPRSFAPLAMLVEIIYMFNQAYTYLKVPACQVAVDFLAACWTICRSSRR